jgi:hypothetical protein
MSVLDQVKGVTQATQGFHAVCETPVPTAQLGVGTGVLNCPSIY